MNDAPSSRRDPHHRAFYLALMRVPGLLHVTVQRRDDTLVSAHINVRSGQEVAMGLLAQSPADAEHSPGVFHIQRLAQLLATQGCHTLDLTPGADPYKERFATEHDTVHVLTMDAPIGALKRRAAAVARRGAKAALRRLGVQAEAARRVTAYTRSAIAAAGTLRGTTALVRQGLGRLAGNRVVAYHVDARGVASPLPVNFEIDSIRALLAYRPGPLGGVPRRYFLGAALARFADGSRVATQTVNGALVFSAWVSPATGVGHLPSALAAVPDRTPVVHDICMTAEGPDHLAALANTIRLAAEHGDSDQVIVLAGERDLALRRALRRLGTTPPGNSPAIRSSPSVRGGLAPGIREAEAARQV